MNKKTIAFILIGVAALGGIIYLLMKKSGSVTAVTGSTGKSQFDKDDTEAYNKIKAMVANTPDYGWAAQYVTDRYNTNPVMLYGKPSKALTLHTVLGQLAPNPNGKFPATNWSGGKPLLWPDADFAKMWQIKTELENKYSPINQ